METRDNDAAHAFGQLRIAITNTLLIARSFQSFDLLPISEPKLG